MKKSDFVQISVGFTSDQADWLRARKAHGYNMTALVRQALDEFIEKFDVIVDDDDEDFCDACGGGQGYHDMVELPVEGSPEAEALAEMVRENMAKAAQDQDNDDDEKLPFLMEGKHHDR